MVESLDELLRDLKTEDQSWKKSRILIPNHTVFRSALLSDINEILDLDLKEMPSSPRFFQKSNLSETLKCCPTFIGGDDPALKNDCSSVSRTCLALHCRECDFPVSSFPSYEWIESVEYLFLRTNMPKFEKLVEKLRKKNGSIAYACHCVSFSTDKLRSLHETDLPWFCRGHS